MRRELYPKLTSASGTATHPCKETGFMSDVSDNKFLLMRL